MEHFLYFITPFIILSILFKIISIMADDDIKNGKYKPPKDLSNSSMKRHLY